MQLGSSQLVILMDTEESVLIFYLMMLRKAVLYSCRREVVARAAAIIPIMPQWTIIDGGDCA